ncbi:MAG: DUF1592 domain-containing protein [Opitutaceae bacterium]
MPLRFSLAVVWICLVARAAAAVPPNPTPPGLEIAFHRTVQPFLETYCLSCHGKETTKADLDLSLYTNVARVTAGFTHWELVLERLEAGDMPNEKAKHFPSDPLRAEVVAWIRAFRQAEATKNAGDPGPVLARRLSNAEYDYTIRDLTGVDIRPTKEFPVDPANQAGFDNSGESLAMSPALLKKYLGAARTVAEHLVLQPAGFAFAPHPAVVDTDRDRYSVQRIIDFYRRQPTDYADYFLAAWRFRNRAALGRDSASLEAIALEARVSPQYLATIWATLTGPKADVGPIATLQTRWLALPVAAPTAESAATARAQCEQLRDFVVRLRDKIIPDVTNLTAPPMQQGSQVFVLWKDRRMAENRRRYDVTALQVEGQPVAQPAAVKTTAPTVAAAGKRPVNPNAATSATYKMALARIRVADPDLTVPADPAERIRHEAEFARFAAVFPDTFYISERARVYADPEKEKSLGGRLLSAGLHSMTGFFRDDTPLSDLILDEPGRRELDRLWREFDYAASVPQRMHISFVWFERTDSRYMTDAEFDPYRPEDKSVTSQEKVGRLAEIYLAKAQKNNASETVQQAIREHFEIAAANILQVERDRIAAEPSHLRALQDFAARAYRRPLTNKERAGLVAFYRESRDTNGLDHEDAMRDCLVSVLMSPYFCYRIDLVDPTTQTPPTSPTFAGTQPLSDYALASRLSYFLWSSLPDAELLAHAAAGDLHEPKVIAAQSRRLLTDDRIRNFTTEFGGNWLDFRRFEEINTVDRERFPAFTNELRAAMFAEPLHFLIDLVRADRPVLNLLYADYTFVNPVLAQHYGMPGVTGAPDHWVRIEHADRFARGGLLPMAVFLTANSPGLRTSPVKRGHWVVSRLLGERIPPPPPTVAALPPDESKMGDLTLRDALARHREDKSCASCHARIDSFGLVFEGFGPVGERREKDLGDRPVDTRASFPGGQERTGVTGLREFLHDRRESDFLDNLCRKLAAYALGRTLLPSDDGLIRDMRAKLATNQQRFSSLVETIVTSPQFLTKRVSSVSATLPAHARD